MFTCIYCNVFNLIFTWCCQTCFGRCTCRTCSANSREIWTQPQQMCEGMSPWLVETLEKYCPDSHDISAPLRCGRGCLLLHPEGVCWPNKYHCAELERGPEVGHGGAKLLETYCAQLRLGCYTTNDHSHWRFVPSEPDKETSCILRWTL